MRVIGGTVLVFFMLLLMPAPVRADCSFTIANWNMQRLSKSKVANNQELVDLYVSILGQYDVIWIQELMGDGEALTETIANDPRMENYYCKTISVRSGRGRYKERYGLCYLKRDLRITLEAWDDIAASDGDYVSIVDSPQPAQNVWMRPPTIATLTFRPKEEECDLGPYTFRLLTLHTKPSYAKRKTDSTVVVPPGTPKTAQMNQSVHYELRATQLNFGNPAGGNYAILGDLNADCVSYPAVYRGTDLAGWNWLINYGEKTNTALDSHCAYDRILLNDAMAQSYISHGIFRRGIATEINGKTVSDHFLVWVEIGDRKRKRGQLAASIQTPVVAKRSRVFEPEETPIHMNGEDLSSSSSSSEASFVVVRYDQQRNYKGNETYTLVDVRGAPTPVTITSEGTLAQDVIWNQPVAGAYTMVLDVNRDGKYIKADGDFTTYGEEIDFIVTEGTTHSEVVALGDDANVQETFDSQETINVYALARSLPTSAEVDVYVVSTKLLPETFTTWAAERARPTFRLPSVSVPIKVRSGPIMVSSLTDEDKVNRVTTAVDGRLFVSAWFSPADLMNLQVLTSTPKTPVYLPDYVEVPAGTDPCATAFESGDANLKLACNVGNQFSDYYGTSFNIVIDVNRDGLFNDGDKVDEHDIADMARYFTSNDTLDARTPVDEPAVGEYKEYLDAKLNLTTPLAPTNVYDKSTRIASATLICNQSLTKSAFEDIVVDGAQVGFEVLNATDYLSNAMLLQQATRYARIKMDRPKVVARGVCVSADMAEITSPSAAPSSTGSFRGRELRVVGENQAQLGSTLCTSAWESISIAPGSEFTVFSSETDPQKTSIQIAVNPDGTGLPCR